MNSYGKAALIIAALSIVIVILGNVAWHPAGPAPEAAPRIYRGGHYWLRVGDQYVHDPKCPMVMNDIHDGYNGYGQR